MQIGHALYMHRRRGPAMRLDDPQWLRWRYVDDGASTREIAEETGVSPRTVRVALADAGVPRRPQGRPVTRWELNDAQWLTEHYVTRELATWQMAELLGVGDGAVRKALQRAGIPRRPPRRGARVVDPRLRDESWLREAYVVQGRTMRSIAVELGCSTRPVFEALRARGISR